VTVYINGVLQAEGNGSGGVSQATFDAHTHNYRKPTQISVDIKKDWSSPTIVDIVDNALTHADGSTDIEATGITVSTQPTSTPN